MRIVKTELTFLIDDHKGYGDEDLFEVSTGWDNLIEDLYDAGFLMLHREETELEVKDLSSEQKKNYIKLEDQYLLDKFENLDDDEDTGELRALLVERGVLV